MRRFSRCSSFPPLLALACLALAVSVVAPPLVQGQVLYGTITGNVKDPSGAAVPGATVTITNTATNQSREAISTETGSYLFPNVQTGAYTIAVSMTGFKAYKRTDVTVTLNTITRVDIPLEVGGVSETVTVSGASTPVLQTDRAEVKSEFSTKALEELPVPVGRNYQGLLKTVPGFTIPENAHSIPSNPSRALRFNVNGTSASINNIRVDGVTGTNVWLPHMTSYIPSLEAIETVNIVTGSWDAEQGLAGGAAVNVQIKSGTNQLHGSAYEYHTDNALKAKPFFNPTGFRKPKYIDNQFGGTIGGPIIKDRLFYFAAYEGTRNNQFGAQTITMPTRLQKQGNFSESANPIYDPATGTVDGKNRTVFANNIIPANRIDPVAAKLIALMPDPNIPNLPANQFTNNYYAGGPFAFSRNTIDTKFNWIVNQKLSMNGRYSLLKFTMDNPQWFGDKLGGDGVASFAGNPGYGFGSTHSVTVGVNYVWTPKFILDGNFGWTKMNTAVEQCCLDKNIGKDVLGIPGTNGTRPFEGGWPTFSISNYAVLGMPNNFMPYYRHDPQWQWTGNANWIKGRHNIRFGFDLSFQDLNHLQPEFYGGLWGAPGGFTFGGGPTTLNGGPAPTQFNNFASFMLGLPTQIGKILVVPDDGYSTRTRAYSMYVRDQWQLNPKLTVSYGIRWEYYPIPTRDDRGIEQYDPNTNKMTVCGVGSIPEDCGVKMPKDQFAPRFGIAYRATDTFVIRAGYGITIDPFNIARPMRANHPIAVSSTYGAPNSWSWAGTLKDGIPTTPVPSEGNGVIDMPLAVDLNYLANPFRRGYIQSWNLTLQKQLPWNLVAQAGYVATRQIRVLGFIDLNYGEPGGGRNSQVFYQKYGRQAATQLVGPIGNSIYDSMQLSLERRFAQGFSLQGAYTWSKNLGINGTHASDSNIPIANPKYFNLNRSLLSIDRPHIFNIQSIWELPFGPGRKWGNQNKIVGALAGGWQVNAIFMRQSGVPFTVSASGSSLNIGRGGSQQADQVKAQVTYPKQIGPNASWFDPLAFAPVNDARFGTSGFNILRGPRYSNLDFGVFRDFKITEAVKLSFRMEAFNFTNTPKFNAPGANRSNMTLNTDGTIRTLGGYTSVTSTRGTGREGIDERQFRFGLRLGF